MKIVYSALLVLAACSSETPDTNETSAYVPLYNDVTAMDAGAGAEQSYTPPPPPAPPATGYTSREGDLYHYVAAVSDEDKAKGRVAGNVVTFRYLGRDEEFYRLEHVGHDGRSLAVSKCTNPCQIIKDPYNNIAFNPRSIIGMAFEDAFAGRLKVAEIAKAAAPRRQVTAPPLPATDYLINPDGSAVSDSDGTPLPSTPTTIEEESRTEGE